MVLLYAYYLDDGFDNETLLDNCCVIWVSIAGFILLLLSAFLTISQIFITSALGVYGLVWTFALVLYVSMSEVSASPLPDANVVLNLAVFGLIGFVGCIGSYLWHSSKRRRTHSNHSKK